MNVTEIREALGKLSDAEKSKRWAILASDLTVMARAKAYRSEVPGPAENSARLLECFNELLHLVTGQVLKYVLMDSKRYPDDVLVNILFERAGDAGLESVVESAFKRSLELQV